MLPLFAFTATGVALDLDLHAPNVPRVLADVAIGLAVGKPLGVSLAALAAVKVRMSALPYDVAPRLLIGAAILRGVSDPVALLITNYAFPAESLRAAAKIGVSANSVIAAALGILRPCQQPSAPDTGRGCGLEPDCARPLARRGQRRSPCASRYRVG